MSRILIIGGHGKIALLLEPLLTSRGDQVDALIRNPEQIEDVAATGANPVVADIEAMDAEEMAKIFAEHDAIVWSAGAGGGDSKRTYAVDQDAAIRTLEAAKKAGVDRYVMVSYYGAGPNHGISPDDGFYAYARAKATADEAVRNSGLDWTILGPSRLTFDDPTGEIEIGAGAAEVSRGDVAQVVMAVLNDPSTYRTTIEFNNGSTPIRQAIEEFTRKG